MSAAYEQLASSALEAIGATTALSQLDQIAQQAAAEDWSYTQFLGRLLEPEIAARRQRVIDTNLRFAGLPYHKRLEDFDFSFQPSIDKTLVEELATGRFLSEGRNVLLLGPPRRRQNPSRHRARHPHRRTRPPALLPLRPGDGPPAGRRLRPKPASSRHENPHPTQGVDHR